MRQRGSMNKKLFSLAPLLAIAAIAVMHVAAQAESLPLQGVGGRAAFEAQLADALARRPAGAWVRVTGYHETMAGELTLRGEHGRLAHTHRKWFAHRFDHPVGCVKWPAFAHFRRARRILVVCRRWFSSRATMGKLRDGPRLRSTSLDERADLHCAHFL